LAHNTRSRTKNIDPLLKTLWDPTFYQGNHVDTAEELARGGSGLGFLEPWGL